MTRAWRFVLTCLLGIAIPVQGFAAYSMAWCGPAHHSAALPQAEEAHHHQAVVSGHESHHAQVASSADTSQESSQASTAKANKCISCASCCSAAALPSLPVVLASPVLKDDFAPLEPSGIAVYLSEGLERPLESFSPDAPFGAVAVHLAPPAVLGGTAVTAGGASLRPCNLRGQPWHFQCVVPEFRYCSP